VTWAIGSWWPVDPVRRARSMVRANDTLETTTEGGRAQDLRIPAPVISGTRPEDSLHLAGAMERAPVNLYGYMSMAVAAIPAPTPRRTVARHSQRRAWAPPIARVYALPGLAPRC
jgi:hypothetical protein